MADNKNDIPNLYTSMREGVVKGSSIHNDVKAVSKFITMIVTVLVQICAGFWQVLLRHGFGERYLRAHIASVLVMFVLLGFAMVLQEMPMVLFGILFFGGFVIQYSRAWRRHRRGSVWHSYSLGSSVFRKLIPDRVPDIVLDCVVEPVVPLVVGLICVLDYPFLGVVSLVSALGILWVQLRRYLGVRDMILDQIDQQIEARNLASVMEDREDPQSNQGFELAGVNNLSDDERELFRRRLAQVDPSLNDLLDKTPEAPEAPEIPAVGDETLPPKSTEFPFDHGSDFPKG